ncbi:DNA-binding domain-containing protein [Frigidibacter sp. SD6-1]|uniref:HvfC/BufC N-terminal domain-containing protein n=1 Tax=Frigidibacter sp. SD6-1 TaxID=3032581 RepID=UPI0024DFB650|nr:DNA-binding domain-containing protein [Frigidibacter sp. SD6-1]
MSQSAFRAAILDPHLPVPPGITDPEGRVDARRFGVYRNNVTVSLTEALRQSFPTILKLVGEEFFAAMAREHLRAHPPASPLMMFYGEAMPAFLESFPPVAHLGYLPDVARLELALRRAYHAADAAPVAPEVLQALPPDRLMASRLTFAPAVRLLRSRWPVHAIWSANMRGTPAPAKAEAQDVLIVRPEYDPEPMLLPAGAGDFIAALLQGEPFGAALEKAGTFDLTAAFGILLAGGAITAINDQEAP